MVRKPRSSGTSVAAVVIAEHLPQPRRGGSDALPGSQPDAEVHPRTAQHKRPRLDAGILDSAARDVQRVGAAPGRGYETMAPGAWRITSAFQNKRAVYAILFRAAAEAMRDIAAEPASPSSRIRPPKRRFSAGGHSASN